MADSNVYVDENGVSEFPLAHQQKFIILAEEKALAMHGKRDGNTNSGGVWRMKFALDTNRLEQSIQKVINVNDALRLVLVKKENEYYQKIIRDYKFKLDVVDAVGKNDSEKYDFAINYAKLLFKTEIDYYNDISAKFALVRLNTEDNIFIFVGHHWIGDGSSLTLTFDEIMKYYKDPEAIEEYKATYLEFMKYENAFVKSERGQKQLIYWKNELMGYKEINITPASIGRKATKVEQFFSLDKKALENIAAQQNTSHFNVMILAYHIAITKVLNANDTVIGFSVANRLKKEFLKTNGYLSRAVQNRLIIQDTDRLVDLILFVKKKISNNIANQQTSHYNDNSQFYISYQNYMASKEQEANESISQIQVEVDRVLTFLTLIVFEGEENLQLIFVSDPQIFCAEFLLTCQKYMKCVIELLEYQPDSTVADVQSLYENKRMPT